MSKRDWQVGDRVQKINADHTFSVGSVTDRVMITRELNDYSSFKRGLKTETTLDKVAVKWDDGTQETLGIWSVEKEDSELEREFRKVAPAILDQIESKLAVARTALREATDIANQHGIPFSSDVSPLSQSYMTPSFTSKWPDVAAHVVEEVTQAYHNYGEEYYGWVHSAVC